MNIMLTSSTWTDDRVTLLRKLWAEGLTGDQIAAELGGVTRNSVIGKIHRLGLSGRVFAPVAPTPAAKAPRPPRPPKTAPSVARPIETPAVLLEPVPDVEPDGARCSILELTEFTCRWPIGHVGAPGFAYCGSRTKGGLVYCAWHARIAYQPLSERDRRRAERGERP